MTRMTREEAAEILDGRNIVDRAAYLEALEVAANALCTRTAYMKELDEVVNTLCESVALSAQQAPTKLDRSRWKGCEFCLSERQDQGPCVCACSSFNISNKQYATRFCPACGKPLIEEAWAELERRIGGES